MFRNRTSFAFSFHEFVNFTNNIGADFQGSHIQYVTLPENSHLNTSAFYNSWIIELTLPAAISSIPNTCFQLCRRLLELTVLNPTPPTVGNNAFQYTENMRAIYVPAESVDLYKVASGWSAKASIIQAIPE